MIYYDFFKKIVFKKNNLKNLDFGKFLVLEIFGLMKF